MSVMDKQLSTARDRDGVLAVRVNRKLHPELTQNFRQLELTLSPGHRRNYLRRAKRFCNARLRTGARPEDLFKGGIAEFRAAVFRWHRNLEGRFAWDWDGERVIVFRAGLIDADVTDALNQVLLTKAKSGRRKYVDFLMSFINHEFIEGEGPHDFMVESVPDVRSRVADWLRLKLNLKVDTRNGTIDSSWRVNSADDQPINTRAHGPSAVRQLYDALRTMRLRRGSNPLDINGWDAMTPTERIIWAKRKWPRLKHMPRHAGAQFEIQSRRWYPPIPHDPILAPAIMMAAAEAYPGFPLVLKQQLEVMALEGPRHFDLNVMLSGWIESDFSDTLWVKNKASREEEAKRVVLPSDLQQRIHERINADHLAHGDPPATSEEVISRVRTGRPVWPSMQQVREIAAMGEVGREVLAQIALFPSSRGRPYAYSTWNNHWLRPALKAYEHGRISTTIGEIRPTGIWLRRAMYTREVGRILATCKTPQEVRQRMELLAMDKGLAGPGPIYRYAKSAFPAAFSADQVKRARESHEGLRRKKDEALTASAPTSTSRPALPVSRPRSRARD